MTSTPTLAPDLRATPSQEKVQVQRGATFARTLHAEWIKFGSLRSSWAILASGVVGLIAIAVVIAYNTGRSRAGLAPEDTALSATLQGYHLSELAAGVLGVLFVSGEYATGMIRSTLAAVPKRVPVLLAKVTVLGGVLLAVMSVASLVAFLGSQALLGHYHHGFSLSDPTAVRVVLGTGLYLTLIALLGSALGWITRSTPGGISAFVAVTLLLPVLFGQLLGSWGKDLVQWLPNSAGQSFITTLLAQHSLSAAAGLAVMLAWVLGALTVAAVLLRRRDA